MDYQALVENVKAAISGILQDEGIELIELKFLRTPQGQILRLLVDRAGGGINVGECAMLNRRIIELLDKEAIIADDYILEVSSPGLDRPLKTKNDFLRCLNKKARFFLLEPVNGRIEYDGLIEKVEGDSAWINVNTVLLELPIAKIRMAKQILEDTPR